MIVKVIRSSITTKAPNGVFVTDKILKTTFHKTLSKEVTLLIISSYQNEE